VLDEKALNERENNYTLALSTDNKVLGIAVADVSTGDFQAAEFAIKSFESVLVREISSLRPAECILDESLYSNHELLKVLSRFSLNIYKFEEWHNFADQASLFLKNHFKVESLAGFGIDDKIHAQKASAALLGYLQHTQKSDVNHIQKIRIYSPKDYLLLDRSTITNLELFSTIREHDEKGTLISLLDHTATAMGGRMIREWLKRPLRYKKAIDQRLQSVEELYKNPILREKLYHELYALYDIERILSRISVGLGVAADLINLKDSFISIIDMKSTLKEFHSPLLKNHNHNLSPELKSISTFIDTHIEETAANSKEGRVIKSGVNSELDNLRQQITGGKQFLANLEEKERQRTKINSLKIRYNQVFGYYIEISKANLALVPANYIRKQTLVNAERFITPELKEKEELIILAQEKIEKLETKIFNQVIEKILDYTPLIQQTAKSVAVIDCLVTLADLAECERYIKPKITTDGIIDIKEGRHPVVEKMLSEDDSQFVPNDIYLDNKKNQLLLITGPNMAGKSVFIRQVAIITLLAHIGSFVPASSAKISVVDRIFVRSGASDVIASGLSTFMVEMVETANILNHATKKSLIVVDEIGRGTSTYDGISIAWAIAEYLVSNSESSAKTLFATHYHELQNLEKKYPQKISNYQMAVEEENGEPVFLHQVIPGGTSSSYAIAVAKLAGIPKSVTDNASRILISLEKTRQQTNLGKTNDHKSDLENKLSALDINSLTPVEAINILAEFKKTLVHHGN
jgi:DNA mismatch repair protein MutS